MEQSCLPQTYPGIGKLVRLGPSIYLFLNERQLKYIMAPLIYLKRSMLLLYERSMKDALLQLKSTVVPPL